jgi:hypothetical protein
VQEVRQKDSIKVSPDDAITVKEDRRLSQLTLQEVPEPVEDLPVICRIASICHDDGGAVRTTPSSPSPLAVIRRPRGHISEQNAIQASNVDSQLHRRRGGEHIPYAFAEKVLQSPVLLW